MKKTGLLALLAILVLFAALSVSAYADAFDELVAANNYSDTDPFTGLTQALADETVHFYEMSDKGSVTILQNTVIRSDFNVSAMNTELIIPAGVTLTLNGSMSATQLTVQEGGTLRVEGSSGRLYQKGRPVRDDKGTSAYQIKGLLEVVDGGKLNLRPESWDGINKDKINAHGEDALISISVPINAENAAKIYDAMDNLSAVDIPNRLRDHVNLNCEISFPWVVDENYAIPAGINVFVFNNGVIEGQNAETGSLTVNADLSIPGNTNLAMQGSNLMVNGTIENYGRIELTTRNGGPDGTMPSFTLSETAEYDGTGMIWVRSYSADPDQYLVGFDENLSRYNRDNMGGQYRYINEEALLAELKDFCNPGNLASGYTGLCNIDTFTIPAGENITIPEGKKVSIFGTVLTIEQGATLEVQGELEAGNPVTAAGTLKVSGESWNTQMNLHAGLSTPGSGVLSIENPNANVEISGAETINYDTFYSGLNVQMVNGSLTYGYIVRSLIDLQVVMSNVDRTDNRVRHDLQLHDMDIAVTENLQVPENVTLHVDGNWGSVLSVSEGATLTLLPGSGIHAYGSDIQVNGVLVNMGEVRLGRTGDSQVSNLNLNQGSMSYSGGGTIVVETNENPKSHVVGVAPEQLLLVDENWDSSRYRIATGEMHTLQYGDSFTVTTVDEGLGLQEYTKSWLFTPNADGCYEFTLSFADDTTINRNEAWYAIIGTEVNGWDFSTDDPWSMSFRTMLKEGEGYEFLLSNVSRLESLTATVTVSAADGIESSNAFDTTPTSAQMNVTYNVTPETAEAGYNWGIAYSSDESFFDVWDDNVIWQRWGWNPSDTAGYFEEEPSDLAGMVPGKTYYYKAILFRQDESTDGQMEILAQENNRHIIDLPGKEVLTVQTGETKSLESNEHSVFQFTAQTDGYYGVRGTNTDYVDVKSADGNLLPLVADSYLGNVVEKYFWVDANETVFLASGHFDYAGDAALYLDAAQNLATVLTAGTSIPVTASEQVFLFAPQTEGWYAVELDDAGAGRLHRFVDGNSEDYGAYASSYFDAGQNAFYLVYHDMEQTLNIMATRAGDSLADILAAMGKRDGDYWFNITDATEISGELEVPKNVALNLHAPVTVTGSGTLINRSDIFIYKGGSLTIGDGGTLQMVDTPDEEWRASIELDGGFFTAVGEVEYGNNSCVVLDITQYDNRMDYARGQIVGVSDDRIEINCMVNNQNELLSAMSGLTNYRAATMIFSNQNGESGTGFTLEQNMPEKYGFVLNDGVTLTVPVNTEVDVEGWIALEFGDLVINGTMNHYGNVNFQRSESQIVNNGTLNLYGWITASTFHTEENPTPTGTINNKGHLVIYPDSNLVDAVSVLNDDSDVQTGILNSYEGKMTLPEDLTEVESEAFSSLPAQVVVFPDGIQSIGDKAFANCTGLLYAVIPTSETVNFGVDVFDGCSNLILVGPLGSSVEEYAQDNEMPFAVLN